MALATSLIHSLFTQQKQYIESYFQHLDLEVVEKVLALCLQCKGLIVLTGVGKSGIIAEKIAMTLVSTGTRALYLPAFNFLHGDIGAVGEDDVVLMLSKSGKTQELVDLVPHLKQKGAHIVAAVSDSGSLLAQLADQQILLPVEKELCPFDLAPTISTTAQLLFGDLLSITLMKEKGFSIEEFAGNHPSGAIGQKVTFLVEDLMKSGKDLPVCREEDRLVDVIVELSDKRCGCLLVLSREDGLLGIFTDGDLRRALQSEGALVMDKTMQELMSKDPIVVGPKEFAHSALQKMQEKKYVMVAPVIAEGKVVGLIRMHDIIHKEI
ncbi:MAG: KpsF/GutQ family sugar-phosphate isomerase [Simkaniaceae bacterium]|nr:KpsF/GutQ family sugar-phosphate isomerase [Candidatus Sacchlamyda saccharinae]